MTSPLPISRALKLLSTLGSEVNQVTGTEAEAAGHPDKLYIVDGTAYDLGETRDLVEARVAELMTEHKLPGEFRTLRRMGDKIRLYSKRGRRTIYVDFAAA